MRTKRNDEDTVFFVALTGMFILLSIFAAYKMAWALQPMTPIIPKPGDYNDLTMAENLRRINEMMKNVPDAYVVVTANAGWAGMNASIPGITTTSTVEAWFKTYQSITPVGIAYVAPAYTGSNTVLMAFTGVLTATSEIVLAIKY